MRKIAAGLSVSLDGVSESPPDWMMLNHEADEVIRAGIAESDAVLLGRNTYAEFARMWPGLGDSSPMAAFLNNTPKYVVSSTLAELGWSGSTLLGGDLAAELSALKSKPGKNIHLPGSPRLVRSLLLAGLLDELNLLIHPIVLGSGTRLFENPSDRVDLVLAASRAFGNGVLSVTYRPKRH
ncbi:dihydrofolate reductase family protein [Amycolatopsis circi]|uniref:dihydrofolate reductase family protein n=1 Tax=Amycolatopsis circi TaxID=871959 RepID=UPI000E254CDC|nr:dihydrofolate reductase family protein [Amycolatopsis circi]